MKGKLPKYPIRVAAKKTGLTPFVIRSWEKRYDAVKPERTDTNRRLYSGADLERLALLKALTEEGYRIGHVAPLDDEQLARLAGEAPGQAARPSSGGGTAANLLDACIEAVASLDRAGLEERLETARVELSLPTLLDDVIAPLLAAAGENWRSGKWRIVEEHLASGTVRGTLQRIRNAARPEPSAPAIVVTTPAGQRHELGALMASVVASAEGWRDIYLGPDLPAPDIVHAVVRTNARALALSVIHPGDDPRLAEEFAFLGRHLPSGVPVFVGGAGAGACPAALDGAKAERVASLADFRARLSAIRGLPATG